MYSALSNITFHMFMGHGAVQTSSDTCPRGIAFSKRSSAGRLAHSSCRRSVKHFLRRSQSHVCHVADFNTEPHDSLYALMIGDTLSPSQIKDLEESAAIHTSIDPSVEISVLSTHLTTSALKAAKKAAASDPAARALLKKHRGEDPTRECLVNVRPAVPSDGLFSVQEFLSVFPSLNSPSPAVPFTSAYGSCFRNILTQDRSLSAKSRQEHGLNVFSSRIVREADWDISRDGADEPIYTNYTRQWKMTLVSSNGAAS